MNDEQLKQRIQYLIEHGGMLDDPLRRLQIKMRLAVALSACAVLLQAISLMR